MAMKVVRQARLELSGGSTPDQLRPPQGGGGAVLQGGMGGSRRVSPPHHIPVSTYDGQEAAKMGENGCISPTRKKNLPTHL